MDDVFFHLFGESSDHTADYPLKDITRNVNAWYDKTITKVLQADTRFEWDDANKTDLPIARLSLVAGQRDYGIAGATYLKVRRVEIKDANGQQVLLSPVSLEDFGVGEASLTNGTPRFYYPRGSSIFLDRAPDYSRTASTTDWGIRIFYQRSQDLFVSTDTTKVPGFAAMFHRILSYGAALDYAIVNGMRDKATLFRQEIEILFNDLQDFYTNRNMTKVSLKTQREDFGQFDLTNGARGTVNPDGFNIL